MAEPKRLTPAERARVVSFAIAHGPREAARKFGVPLGTVKVWQHRAKRPPRRRPARPRPAAPTPEPTSSAAQQFDEQVRRLAAWAAGGCIRCAGDGTVDVSAVYRGTLLIRAGKRISCPECGGRVRHLQVTEWPRREWVEGIRVAGDAGFGWSGDEWARIRAGEPNPDGRRITGRPDAS
jgi:hypothetical protein